MTTILPCWCLILFRIYFAHLELIKFGSPQWHYTRAIDKLWDVPLKFRRLGETVVEKYLIYGSACCFIDDVKESIDELVKKNFDIDEKLEQIYYEGISCHCFERKHWDFHYYEGTFASRELRRIWREIGCPLHHPAAVFDGYDSDE